MDSANFYYIIGSDTFLFFSGFRNTNFNQCVNNYTYFNFLWKYNHLFSKESKIKVKKMKTERLCFNICFCFYKIIYCYLMKPYLF